MPGEQIWRLFGLSEHHAVAVSAGSELDDDWQTNLLQEIIDVGGIARDESLWGINAGLGENLLRAQFITSTSNCDGA